MLPFPINPFESRRVENGGSNSLSLVRFNCNDYSVPTKYAHRNVTIVGSIDRVRIVADSHVVAEHEALKLPSIHSDCEKVAARCAKENVDHLGFLLQLCEQELLDREKRASERRLKAAKFPNYKTLEDFDFKAQPSINRVLVSELMRGQYIDNRESVILIGQQAWQ